MQLDFGVTRCRAFDVCTRAEMWHVGSQKNRRPNWFDKMRYSREAPIERELSYSVGRNCQHPGETKKPTVPCGWTTRVVKSWVFIFLLSHLRKDSGQPQSSHLHISGRRVGSSGKTVKPEFVNGQIFG